MNPSRATTIQILYKRDCQCIIYCRYEVEARNPLERFVNFVLGSHSIKVTALDTHTSGVLALFVDQDAYLTHGEIGERTSDLLQVEVIGSEVP
jgi:hypothetical protein